MMRAWRVALVLALVMGLAVPAVAQEDYAPTPENLKARAWFQEARGIRDRTFLFGARAAPARCMRRWGGVGLRAVSPGAGRPTHGWPVGEGEGEG